MEYRKAMAYLNECMLGAILIAADKRIAEYNPMAEKLLGAEGGIRDKPLELAVRFIPMGDTGIVYAHVGVGRYIKQCPAPEPHDLPAGWRWIVFREATKDILFEMLSSVVKVLGEKHKPGQPLTAKYLFKNVTPAHIPEHIHIAVQGHPSPNGDSPEESKSLPEILDDVEQRVLAKALWESGGNVAQAARALGISRQNLNYRLKKAEERHEPIDLFNPHMYEAEEVNG